MKRFRFVPYLVVGALFGIVLSKTEVISWFRIQEMFRFQSFHMYGIIGSAVAVGMGSLYILRRTGLRTAHDEPIEVGDKRLGTGRRYLFGGIVFGIGWALTGACPGPMFALIGNGLSVAIVILLAALVGARTYAAVQHRLPH